MGVNPLWSTLAVALLIACAPSPPTPSKPLLAPATAPTAAASVAAPTTAPTKPAPIAATKPPAPLPTPPPAAPPAAKPTTAPPPQVAAPTPVPPAKPTTAPAKVPTGPPAPSVAPKAGGPVKPVSKDDCPPSHPIKGNQGSREQKDWIYHTRASRAYAATDPEECFATEADAQAAGYRPPQN